MAKVPTSHNVNLQYATCTLSFTGFYVIIHRFGDTWEINGPYFLNFVYSSWRLPRPNHWLD